MSDIKENIGDRCIAKLINNSIVLRKNSILMLDLTDEYYNDYHNEEENKDARL